MRFGSVCSGIEAASVAWNPLGWKAQWLAEIEPFPCSLLKHHYPDTPNLGDMTKYNDWPTDDKYAIDLLCGGTPCQSFSVAGLRKGLDDPRGNLMLTFGAIAAKYRPQWLVWENVPGVLSSNGGRDFGSFLGMLGQLGYGFAYRVLDAQYFGVAQRRRRVFVVGCLGDWRSAAAVLFERYSLQGHPAPRRQAGQVVTPTIRAGAANGGAGHGARSGDSKDELIVPVTGTLQANGKAAGSATQQDAECGMLVPICFDTTQITSAANYSNPKAGDPCHPLAAQAHVPCIAFPERMSGTQCASTVDLAPSMGAANPTAVAVKINACAQSKSEENKGFNKMESIYACTQETDAIALLRGVRKAIGAQAFAQWGLGILDSLQQTEILRSALHGSELRPASFTRCWVVCCALASPFSRASGAMRSMREAAGEGCSPQGWGFSEQQLDELGAYLSELSQPGAQAERLMRDLWQASEGIGVLRNALSAIQEAWRPTGREGQPVRSGSTRGPAASTEDLQGAGLHGQIPREGVLQQACPAGVERDAGSDAVDQARGGSSAMAVRRLTVEECEFLQGFPRSYAAVPHRGKPAADGPRYKSLGNSWAVPNVRWIGKRIDAVAHIKKAQAAINTVAELEAA